MRNILAILIVIAAFSVAGTSCKKNDDNNNTTSVDSGFVYLHLHTNIDTNEADYNTVYTDANGRQISLSKAQLYLSNIRMIKTDGTQYALPNSVIILKDLETEAYFLAKVPTGSYKSIMFNVGLDATTNAKTPTAADSALNHPDMWFGSSAQPDGYVFVDLEGSVDTTAAGNGSTALMQPFTYKIGTNAHLNTVTMPDHTPVYSIAKDESQFVHIIIDYSKLLNGVPLNNSANLSVKTAADNNSAVSNTISNNVPSMFRYEE